MDTFQAKPPIEQMIDKKTILLGFIATMATSSKIPRAFSKYFLENGKNGSMVGLNIREDDLLYTLNGMKQSQLRGAIIGSEYAKAALKAMDHITKEAEIAGFIDACVIQDGKLIGHIATSSALVSLMPIKQSRRVAILGAGAMAKALCLQLDEKGFDEVVFYVDRVESAMELIETVSPYVTQIRFDVERISKGQILDAIGFDYIINATPAGLFEHDKIVSIQGDSSLSYIDLAFNTQNSRSLFEAFAHEDNAQYIGAAKIIEQTAPIHYRVWFAEEPKNATITLQRG